MDRNYHKHKRKMLEELCNIDCSILYAYYSKNGFKINQTLKQSIYITLLSKIVSSVDEEVEIIFDGFGIEEFENDIVKSIKAITNVKSIRHGDSQEEKGLQFIDNVCSSIRHHITEGEKDMYYEIIADLVRNCT